MSARLRIIDQLRLILPGKWVYTYPCNYQHESGAEIQAYSIMPMGFDGEEHSYTEWRWNDKKPASVPAYFSPSHRIDRATFLRTYLPAPMPDNGARNG